MSYFPNECCQAAHSCICGLPGTRNADKRDGGYDERCYELATVFLSDDDKNSPANRHKLAQAIQQAVETEIEYGLEVKTMGGQTLVPDNDAAPAMAPDRCDGGIEITADPCERCGATTDDDCPHKPAH